MEELAAGQAREVDAYADDAVAVIVRYLRAAHEGNARLNLRLLAKAIAGQLQTRNLVADEFFEHAEALATLSRNEIIFIAALFNHSKGQPNVPPEEMGEQERQSPWLKTKAALVAQGWTPENVSAVAARSVRSGFVLGQPAWDEFAYMASPILAKLSKTVDFDDALRREAA